MPLFYASVGCKEGFRPSDSHQGSAPGPLPPDFHMTGTVGVGPPTYRDDDDGDDKLKQGGRQSAEKHDEETEQFDAL